MGNCNPNCKTDILDLGWGDLLKTPAYVEEFHRWHGTSPESRWRVLWDQVKRGIEPGPGCREPIEREDLDLILCNGKRLMDCSTEDMQEIEEWQRAIRIAKQAYESP
jgi:hypothetical protein